jgi:hypothetical protein
MTNRHATAVVLTVAAAIALVCGCGASSAPTQAGSETTSGVEIAIHGNSVSGTASPSAKVMIYSTQYTYGDTQWVADSAFADTGGAFAFNGLPEGSYNLYVFTVDPAPRGAAFLGLYTSSKGPDGNQQDTAPLSPLCILMGTATYNGSPDKNTRVFITGSPFYSTTDTRGGFGFTGVPFGAYTVVARLVVRSNILSDSAFVDFSQSNGLSANVALELK